MNLHGIVAVSGKPGLWRALAQNKTGFILESLDAQKIKLVANLSTAKLAALDEITIFSYDEDIRLKDVLAKMKTAANVPDTKADGNKLRAFFREVAPDHDEEKVYSSDMKKIVGWFHILKDMPLFNEEEPAIAEPVAVEAPVAEETVTAEAPLAEAEPEVVATEKPKAAKAPKKKKTE
ncbi:hypothetical protein BDD43_0323 [Mucilaginibacter gracilis]|uniref:Uncharacterized protein n=1 Tax=Mucilaginibacter gracilis TaxID=423350 RepID=A0A495ITZ1_9SPHI|nr:DUF5606 domain-containing protein [Mucilaginibacter gracilis]RKR80227.1 hypothetical protein BDD43_0323 [Mucilaginibacter gracilis]